MDELLFIFADNIAPILIIAAIGYLVGQRLNIDPKPISTLIFFVLSPALVFNLLYTSEIGGGEVLALFVGTIALHVTMLTITLFTLRFRQVDSTQRANVILSVVSVNSGNYGLSLIAFAFGDAVLTRAVVIFVTNSFINFTLGVYIASNGRLSPKDALKTVFKTPTVYAVIAAFALRVLQIELPPMLARSASTLSQATIPMLLVLLGLQLGQFQRITRPELVLTGASVRMLIGPVVGFLLAGLLALNPEARTAFIIEAAMPTGVITLVLASQFDLDSDLALSLILSTTLVSPLTLSVLIHLLR